MKLFLSFQSFFVTAALAVAATTLPDGSNDHLSKRATGVFLYSRRDNSEENALTGLPDDTCFQIPGGTSKASNHCDTTAYVYYDDSCGEFLAQIEAGENFVTSSPLFESFVQAIARYESSLASRTRFKCGDLTLGFGSGVVLNNDD
ncbi:hypothetical protein DFQ27_006615 [Actinomortierella ambigua]|uniref:Uncharacterized protein n=1 Tax=Actinomortierella ambigua TaxID=1343610 RepID=A0A9P6U0U1_9FUNG|nr:hypothetical protein DFQ27_006615 [Actinomortierella ambigua]